MEALGIQLVAYPPDGSGMYVERDELRAYLLALVKALDDGKSGGVVMLDAKKLKELLE